MFHSRHGLGPKKLSELIWGLRHGKETEILWLDFHWSETEKVSSCGPAQIPSSCSCNYHQSPLAGLNGTLNMHMVNGYPCAQATAEDAGQLVEAVHKWPMRNVGWMSINLHQEWEGEGNQERIKHWLLELLAPMNKLHSLKLLMLEWFPRPMPVLQQLKHLDIRLRNHPSVQELARIAALPYLETLRLVARCDPQRLEELDMSASARLWAVSFVDVRVKKLLLPQDTALTVEGYS